MKRFYIFPLLCFLLLVGCDDSSSDVDVATYSGVELDVSKPIEMASEASTTEIWFVAYADWTASIESTEGGMTISPTEGESGTSTITVTAEENTGFESRSLVVKITTSDGESQTVEVIQNTGISLLEADVDDLTFDSEGGELSFNLSYNMEYVVEVVDTTATWLTVVETKTYGSDKITLKAAANEDGQMRQTNLCIFSSDSYAEYADTVVVYQKANNVFDLSASEFTPAIEGEVIEVTYEVVEGAVYSLTTPDWVSYKWETDDTVDPAVTTITFTVDENDTGVARSDNAELKMVVVVAEATDSTAMITANYYQDIYFTQEQNNFLEYIEINDQNLNSISGSCDTLNVEIAANVAYSAESSVSWLSAGELSNNLMQIIVAENQSGVQREGTFTVTADDYPELTLTVTVTQYKQFFVENLSADTVFVSHVNGETFYLSIKANEEPDHTVEGGTGWIILDEMAAADGEMEYDLSVKIEPFEYDVEEGSFSREGTLSFNYTGSTNTLTYYFSQNYSIENTTAGGLDALLAETYGDDYKSTLTALDLSGSINSTDLSTIASMSVLAGLDMTDATIEGNIRVDAEGNVVSGNAIPYEWLKGNTNIKTIVLPSSLTIIGESSFEESAISGDIAIPNLVTEIKYAAFRNCVSIDGDISFSTSLVSVAEEAFLGCSNFTGDIYFINTVTSIGARAFYGCSGADGIIKLSQNMTVVEESAFEGCSSLGGGLYIPTSVVEIEKNAFKGCSSLSGELTLTAPLSIIRESAFEDCAWLTGTLTIPSTVETLEPRAFMGCSSFTTLSLSSSTITFIDEKVFANCTSFAGTLSIPSTITAIGDYAFYRCEGFTGTLSLHSRFTTVGDYAFYGCKSFTGALTLPASLSSAGKGAFSHCYGMTGVLTPSSNLVDLSEELFAYSRFTGDVNLKSGLLTIGKNAISGTNQAGNLYIPESVTSIAAQEYGLAVTSVDLNWTTATAIPDLTNLLAALKSQFSTEDADGTKYVITIPEGTTSLYQTKLAGYFFEEEEVVE